MNYSFDLAREAANAAKHALLFSAIGGFEWESALVEVGPLKVNNEPRLTAIGLIGARAYVVVFSLRGTTLWLISRRRANNKEIKRYANHH